MPIPVAWQVSANNITLLIHLSGSNEITVIFCLNALAAQKSLFHISRNKMMFICLLPVRLYPTLFL